MNGPLVLGIETSCDETGVAVVAGTTVLSSVLASQTEAHSRFGGVVPEVAARAHVEAIRPMVHQALAQAGVHSAQLDAIAATRGPGLAGALMVGYAFGKSLAWSLDKPFYGIDHMEGHLLAPRLAFPEFEPPAVALLASGGHSQIVHIQGWGRYEVLGATIDDAAGEAFDKLARFIGLGYPGGPAIDAESSGGNPDAIRLPRALGDRPFDLSFSGLKTAVVTHLNRARDAGTLPSRPDVAASIQEAIVDVLVEKTMNAVDRTRVEAIAGGGGVLANRRLRDRFSAEAERRGLALYIPEPSLCTDNGAMVAAVAVQRLADDAPPTSFASDIDPGARLS